MAPPLIMDDDASGLLLIVVDDTVVGNSWVAMSGGTKDLRTCPRCLMIH